MRSVTTHLGLGVRQAAAQPRLFALQTAVDLMAAAAALLPAWWAVQSMLGRLAGGLAAVPPLPWAWPAVLGDLWIHLTSPGFLLPLLGLWAAGAALTAFVRVLYLTGAYGALGAGLTQRPAGPAFMDAVVARFPDAALLAVLLFFAGLLRVAWIAGVVGAGALVFARGLDSASVGAAAALAAALTLAGAVSLLFRGIVRLSFVRTVLAGDPPASAVLEAAWLVLRRPGSLLALALLIGLLDLAVTLTVGAAVGLEALLPGAAAATRWAAAAGGVGIFVRVAAGALVAVAGHAAFAAFALDDMGRLPAPPTPAPVPARTVRPAVPVYRAVPYRPAPPAPPEEQF